LAGGAGCGKGSDGFIPGQLAVLQQIIKGNAEACFIFNQLVEAVPGGIIKQVRGAQQGPGARLREIGGRVLRSGSGRQQATGACCRRSATGDRYRAVFEPVSSLRPALFSPRVSVFSIQWSVFSLPIDQLNTEILIIYLYT
jgi:hypothetical protein